MVGLRMAGEQRLADIWNIAAPMHLRADLDARRVTAGSHIPGTGRCVEDTKGHKGRGI
jgi:hypothetical protein